MLSRRDQSVDQSVEPLLTDTAALLHLVAPTDPRPSFILSSLNCLVQDPQLRSHTGATAAKLPTWSAAEPVEFKSHNSPNSHGGSQPARIQIARRRPPTTATAPPQPVSANSRADVRRLRKQLDIRRAAAFFGRSNSPRQPFGGSHSNSHSQWELLDRSDRNPTRAFRATVECAGHISLPGACRCQGS